MSKAFNEDILKKNLPEMEMAVDTIHLMKSERIRGAHVYQAGGGKRLLKAMEQSSKIYLLIYPGYGWKRNKL